MFSTAFAAATLLSLAACSAADGGSTEQDSGGTGSFERGGAGGKAGSAGSGGRSGAAGAAGMPSSSGYSGAAGSGGIGSGNSGSGGVAGNAGTNGMAGGGAAGASAGTGGASGSAGASGSGSSDPGCGHEPVDRNATREARRLLCYLYSVYGKQVLSGQQEMSWNGDPDVDNEYIQQQTGKLPAVRGQDFLYQGTDNKGQTTTSRARAWWQAGGISQLIYHMGNPTGDDSYDSAKGSCGSGCIAQAISSGTNKNKVLLQRLDHAATELAKLQAANVAVIWRPWHESNGGWFWWGMEGGGEFVKLYKFVFDYFVNTKGLHNLVWEVSWAQNNPDSSWNPGPAYYDIAGPDTYDSSSPFSGQYQAARSLVGGTVPISLQENGLIPDPSAMFSGNSAPWLFFNTWTQFEYAPGNQYGANPTDHLKKVYADSHTITLDQVPNLK